MERQGHFVKYAVSVIFLILSVSFTVLLFTSQDGHYSFLIQERYEFQENASFTNARILSVLVLKAFTSLGFSIEFSSQILAVLATLGVLYAFRSLIEASGNVPRGRATLFAPLILIPMLWNYIISSDIIYPEDIPALLLFTIGLTYLFKKNMLSFSIVFLIATLNRESSIFLLPAMFLIQFKNRKLSDLIIHLTVLAAAWIGIKLLLMHYFGGGIHSSYYINTLRDNLAICKSIFHLEPGGLRLLTLFGGLWLFVPISYRKIPDKVFFLTLMVPVFFAIMVFVGNLDGEFRIFNEMIPVVTAPTALLFSSYLTERPLTQ